MSPSDPLCEDCGYPINDIAKEGAADARCPECGRSVAESLPSRREGSPWQRRGIAVRREDESRVRWALRVGLGVRLGSFVFAWLATNVLALRHPRRLFASLRIEPKSGNGLLVINLLVAAFVVVDPWVGVLIFDPVRYARAHGPIAEWFTRAGVLAVEMGLVGGLLLLLTWVEYRGVRFFARQRGWRLTKEGAWQVCCHASVGWILVGLLPLLGMSLLFAMVYWLGWSPKGVIDLSKYLGPMVPLVGVQVLVTGLLTLGGAIVGLLIFESLVYVGVRRCKFAATVAGPALASHEM